MFGDGEKMRRHEDSPQDPIPDLSSYDLGLVAGKQTEVIERLSHSSDRLDAHIRDCSARWWMVAAGCVGAALVALMKHLGAF